MAAERDRRLQHLRRPRKLSLGRAEFCDHLRYADQGAAEDDWHACAAQPEGAGVRVSAPRFLKYEEVMFPLSVARRVPDRAQLCGAEGMGGGRKRLSGAAVAGGNAETRRYNEAGEFAKLASLAAQPGRKLRQTQGRSRLDWP